MLFFITGASGSGKSASMRSLKKLLPDFQILDFDSIVSVSPDFADWREKGWRHRATEYWLQQALLNQAQAINTILCGSTVMGEVLACPSAPQIDKIAFCLLDCYDVLLIDRILSRKYGTEVAGMETLCWAAWLRMHAVDPQWRQDVIKDNGELNMEWSRWDSWQRGDPRWQMWRLDTTELSLDEVAHELVVWIERERVNWRT